MSDEELSDFLDSEIKGNLKNPDCTLVNNYANKTVKLNLLRFTEWYFDKKPISTEHGVFFKRQEQALNLPALMLEHILNSRKVNKKKMFQAKEAGDKELAKFYNTRQKVDKIFANSYYGVSGQSSSVFYNLFVALSITGKGQSIISTAMTTFERFLANNILFRSLDECLLFIKTVSGEDYTLLDKDNIDRDIRKDELTDYLVNQFANKEVGRQSRNIIQSIVDNIDQTAVNRIYYKNNLFGFLSNSKIFAFLEEILGDDQDFKNPEKLPATISITIQELWKRVKEYVFYNHPVFNRINVLKTIKRKAVIVVDTDSNFLNIEPFFRYVQSNSKHKIDDNDEKMTFKIVNLMSYMLSDVIKEAYWKYTDDCGVPDSHKPIIAMKNEFLMKRVLLTTRKKNYASVVVLQEGVAVEEKDQLDIKGLSIKKSNVNRNTGQYLQDILEKDILASPYIDVQGILRKLESFENDVRSSFASGKTKYMTPAKANEIESYDNPYRQAAIRAALVWNAVNPNSPITFPAQINMVKLTSDSIDKIAPLYKNNKELYQTLKAKIFDDESLGKYGLTYFAMPKGETELPSWVIPLVDVDTIIQDNLKNFLPILNSIGIKTINIKASEMFFSNIVDF
jgi:hypothetical protein